eukprot:3923611-Pyramimonas_sp.AAC.1
MTPFEKNHSSWSSRSHPITNIDDVVLGAVLVRQLSAIPPIRIWSLSVLGVNGHAQFRRRGRPKVPKAC